MLRYGMNSGGGTSSQGYPPSSIQQHSHNTQNQPQQRHYQQQQDQQHIQQQQQHQPQQQQNQPLMNGNQAGGSTADAQSQAASGGPLGQEMNLASVLHYLQSEWRRWERDRNEWEIERGEMRARIALLEGQRRSAENLKVDLLRRVKMLEFALRQERTKTVSTVGKAGTIAPSRLIALQDEDKTSVKDDKEGSGSEGSEEGAGDGPKTNGGASISKASVISGRAVPDTSPWKTIGGAPRDPKSRARSREYLKQCLQEITYLTSPGALNPLPARPPVALTDPLSPGTSSTDPDPLHDGPLNRPRKEIPSELPPSRFATQSEIKQEPESQLQTSGASDGKDMVNGVKREPYIPSEVKPLASGPVSHLMSMETTAKPPSSPAQRTRGLPDAELNGDVKREEPADEQGSEAESSQLLTAIYRPGSKAAWREELRAANEEAKRVREAKGSGSESSVKSEPTDEEALASLTLPVEDEENKGESSDAADQHWTTRRTLKSHLDIVRTVSFAHGPGILLASGGDDYTVKVWSADMTSLVQRKSGVTETEPIMTYRGHTAAVTSVVVSSSRECIISGSLDSTIRIWKLPAANNDPFGRYDPANAIQTLEGHSEAVWDLVLLPSRDPTGKGGAEDRLVSASADGSVKLWQLEDGKWSLKTSHTIEKNVPTCLAVFNFDYSKVLVGLTDGTVMLWDVESGDEVATFGDVLEDGQVNAVLSHPTLPAIISAHEDGHIRFIDLKGDSPTPSHTVLAHPGPVTSLALSPQSPSQILTASVDCTVRIWDLEKKTALQELQGHRKRSDEGVCAVASHPEVPIVASAGADGIIRLWAAL